MPPLETDEPELPGGAVQSYTRGDDLRDIIGKLQNHAHLCIDGQDFEPAQMIVAAAELINQALGALEALGLDEESLESAHTRAGG